MSLTPAPPSSPDDRTLATNLVTQFEGFRNFAYQDPAGIWSQGFGATRDSDGRPITATSPPITLTIGLAWLTRDMAAAFATIAADVKVPLTPEESAALASFIYNVGAGNFASSTLLRLLNTGDYEGAAQQLLLWDHAGGVVLAGLLRRRQAELALFQST